MLKRFSGMVALAAALVFGITACKKASGPNAKADQPTASIHWIGSRQLAADPAAAHLVQISKMPETRRVVNQTLDKLALAPFRPEFKDVDWQSTTNYPPLVARSAHARMLRPLIEDILANESHIHTRKPGSQTEFAIAVRLDPARVTVWKTNIANLANAKGSFLSGAKLSQDGPWTIVASQNAGEKILNSIKAGTSRDRRTTPQNKDNIKDVPTPWLTCNVDFVNLLRALEIKHDNFPNLPQANITISGGAKGAVRTRADFNFPKPLKIELDPWLVPTNLIADPLVGFSAARGIRPLLESTEFWKDNKLGTAPNQAYFWAQRGMPWFHFFGLPSKEADEQVKKIGNWMLEDLNPVFEEYKLGTMVQATNLNGFRWKGIPIFMPQIGVQSSAGTPFIFGGFFPPSPRTKPMPPELLKQLRTGTNIVWYDWEFTGLCSEGWINISQISKHTLGYARLTHLPAFVWLDTVQTNLGNCTTVIKKETPSKLVFTRDSAIAFSSVELNLLVDWLESPDFPAGLHTTRMPRTKPIMKKAGNWSSYTAPTNAPANAPAPRPAKK